MKKLGLVGGMGPESTIPYYHHIMYGVQKKLGKNQFPEISIESVDLFKVTGYCASKEYDKLVDYLFKAIDNLTKAGCDFAALSANTPHIVFDELQKKSQIPLISIIEATAADVEKKAMKKIGLLGTVFTMEGDFFKKPFIEKNIEIVIPNSKERQYINNKLLNEVELGIVKEDTVHGFLNIARRMKEEDKVQAIILGCTEIPLVFKDVEVPVLAIDTMQVHINAIVNEIMSD